MPVLVGFKQLAVVMPLFDVTRTLKTGADSDKPNRVRHWPGRNSAAAAAAVRVALVTLVSCVASLTAGLARADAPNEPPPATDTESLVDVLRGHGGPVKTIAVDPGSRRALSGSFDYSFILWDLQAKPPSPSVRFDRVEGAINAVAFVGNDATGRLLAGGDGGQLWIVDPASPEKATALKGHAAKIVSISVDPVNSARAVTGSWDRTARIWDLSSRRQIAKLAEGHRGPVNAVVFSNDGAQVFTTATDGAIRRFDAGTGALDRAVYKHGWGINALVRLNADNHLVFGAIDGSVGIVDPQTGNLLKRLGKHERPVLAIALSHDGSQLATAGGDGRINVWNTRTWGLIETFENPFGPIWALAFAADGKSLLYGGLDDVIHRWQITPRKDFEAIASKYPRRFQLDAETDDPIELGRIQFARKCSVCHTLTPDGGNRAGPTLHGIFGRPIASLKGYRYSEALEKLDIVWTGETISKLFELGPDVFTPGSKMPLQKMARKRERDALVAFLRQNTGAVSQPADAVPERAPGVVPEEKASHLKNSEKSDSPKPRSGAGHKRHSGGK